jgi:hypothetical protein
LIKGKRVIHIVSFLYYIQEKVWEGNENNEEAWIPIFDVDRPAEAKCCDFFVIFTTFPGFSLGITEETYNIDPTVTFYEKKFPFRTVCFVIRRFWLPIYVSASGRKGSREFCPKTFST